MPQRQGLFKVPRKACAECIKPLGVLSFVLVVSVITFSFKPCLGGNRYGLPTIKSRREIATVLESLKMRTGAELGVKIGTFAEHNLNHWKSCSKYYLIDLWGEQVNYADLSNINQSMQDSNFQYAQHRLSQWQDKTVFLRQLTSKAAENIPANSLDFIYVDARHDYCGVMEDLRLYWPKLRLGGILAGHDYLDATAPQLKNSKQDWSLCANGSHHMGAVKGAVDDFAQDHSLVVTVTYKETMWPTWMARKQQS